MKLCLMILSVPWYIFNGLEPQALVSFNKYMPHLNIPTRTSSDELDKTIQRKWLGENLSH
jgi:hypothetical protein